MIWSHHSREAEFAVQAVRTAAGVCEAVRREAGGASLRKADTSPVTVADFASQALIAGQLAGAFPDDPLIAEEDSRTLEVDPATQMQVVERLRRLLPEVDAGRVRAWIDRGGGEAGDRFWTLDPIDGTKGFLRGRHCAVALALVEAGRPVIGVLGCPRLSPDDAASPDGFDGSGVVAFAAAGEGCWLASVEETTASPRRLRRAARARGAAPRFCQSGAEGRRTSRFLDELAASVGARPGWLRVDGQGKYVLLARGQADAYVRPPRSGGLGEWIWDHAAGAIVAAEAGAVVTDVRGRPLDFTAGARLARNEGVIGADRDLHARLVEAASRVEPPPG